MKMTRIKSFLFVNCIVLFSALTLFAQQEKPVSRFSHKGLKGAVGLGSFENEFGDKLNDGAAGSLSLGYGFSERFTLWLSLVGVEHPQNSVNRKATDFGGGDLSVQYKLLPQSRIQPYGKIGVGVYGIGEQGSGVVFLGGGIAFAVGADWFFSRHVGLGAELQFKNIDYSKEKRRVGGNDIVTEINPRLDGKSTGLMFTLTIQ